MKKLSETTARVIALAGAIRDYWDAELPKRYPKYPIVPPGGDSGPAPPEEAELSELLNKLSDDDLYRLILLMHLGRGDVATDDLAVHYRELKNRFRKREWAIAQLEGKAPLADYLGDGIGELAKSGLDPDNLALEAAGAAT